MQCQPWGHLNKEIESFRGQNSLCDTGDVWDGGCAPIFCLLVTTRHEDGRTPTDILHSTHPHRHFSKHAKKNLLQFPHFVVLKLLWFWSFRQKYVDHWGYVSHLNFVNWFGQFLSVRSCPAVRPQGVILQLSLVRQSSFVRQLSMSLQKVIRQSSGSHQAVVLHLSYILKLDNCNYLIGLKSRRERCFTGEP